MKRFVIFLLAICIGAFFACHTQVDKGISVSKASEATFFSNELFMKNILGEYLEKENKQNKVDFFEAQKVESQAVSFEKVAAIIHNHCTPCHQPNAVAPFSLITYPQIKRKAQTIKTVLQHKIMPPWFADDGYHRFLNAPAITDEQRAMIVQWIVEKCPAPKQPITYVKDTVQRVDLGNPDLSFTVGEEFEIPTNDELYQCFTLDLNLNETVSIQSIEFVSSNPKTIHHIMAYVDTSGIVDTLPASFYCKNDGIVGQMIPIDSWTKGFQSIKYAPWLAIRFPKGAKLFLQNHYGEGHKGLKEKTTVHLYLSKYEKARAIKNVVLNNLKIRIPADSIMVDTIEYCVPKDMSLIAALPHMHFIAQMCEAYAITPDNQKVNLLKLHHWDYLWQTKYYYEKPIFLPQDSKLYFNVVFDNTANNPKQPNFPPREVTYKTSAYDEMLNFNFYYVDYQKNDELLPVGNLAY